MFIMPLLVVSIGYQPAAEVARPLPDLRCGGYSLFILLEALGIAPDQYADFEAELGPPGSSGYSMLQLAEQATRSGAKTLAVRTSLENLRSRNDPFACICLLDEGHFVLLYDLDEKYAHVVDFPRSYKTGVDAFLGRWDGEALLVGPNEMRSEESVTTLRRVRAAIIPSVAAAVLLIVTTFIVIRFRRHSRPIGQPHGLSLLCWLLWPLCATGCHEAGPPAASVIESSGDTWSAGAARLAVEPD